MLSFVSRGRWRDTKEEGDLFLVLILKFFLYLTEQFCNSACMRAHLVVLCLDVYPEWGVLGGAHSPQLATTLLPPIYPHVNNINPKPQTAFAMSRILLTLGTPFAHSSTCLDLSWPSSSFLQHLTSAPVWFSFTLCSDRVHFLMLTALDTCIDAAFPSTGLLLSMHALASDSCNGMTWYSAWSLYQQNSLQHWAPEKYTSCSLGSSSAD